MQMGKQNDLIILDLSKAFDEVAHEKLPLKLHHYGIRGDTLKWIKEILEIENRQLLLMEYIQIKLSLLSQFLANSLPCIYK